MGNIINTNLSNQNLYVFDIHDCIPANDGRVSMLPPHCYVGTLSLHYGIGSGPHAPCATVVRIFPTFWIGSSLISR